MYGVRSRFLLFTYSTWCRRDTSMCPAIRRGGGAHRRRTNGREERAKEIILLACDGLWSCAQAVGSSQHITINKTPAEAPTTAADYTNKHARTHPTNNDRPGSAILDFPHPALRCTIYVTSGTTLHLLLRNHAPRHPLHPSRRQLPLWLAGYVLLGGIHHRMSELVYYFEKSCGR